ncbi:MAG TPA: ABC transporter substrate-binding protein [Desulfotomaculum sp.]|nr:ABC transporter substrate-binding protein [Desulfotomaculum sp.]
MMNKRRVFSFAWLLVALVIFASGCGGNNSDAGKGEIKIGLVGAMSGGGAIYGQQMKKGAELAVEEINKAGGINGKQVKLIVEDDKGSPQEAVKATEKLVSQDKIDYWMGTVNSSNTLAALEVTKKAGIPSMVPIATAEKITEMGSKNIFRNCANNPMQVKALVDYILANRPEKKFAILAENTDYGRDLVKIFEENLTKGGGTILATEYYKPGDKDFYNQLTKIKALNPEGFLVAGMIAEGSQIVKQARELGIRSQFYSFGGFMGNDPIKLSGEAAEGLIHTDYFSPVSGDPVIEKFVNGYKAKYGEVPDTYYSASLYDAVYLYKTAVEKAGSTDKDKVNQAMSQIKDYQGVLGKITFDEKGQTITRVWISQIKNGKQVVIFKP